MRSVIAVIVGVLAGGTGVGIVEAVGHALFPLPAEIDPMDIESIRANLDRIPLGAMISVVIAWATGSVIGAMVASLITGRATDRVVASLRNAMMVGSLLMLAGLMNLLMIPHPLWMWVIGLGLFLPAAWLGWKFSRLGRFEPPVEAT